MPYDVTLTLQSVSSVTHDTLCFRFDRPDGFEFEAGQATHMALDRKGWRDEDRPFTMASVPGTRTHMDFIVKIYPDHDGVTKRMADLKPGDRMLATAPEGAITDKGEGTYLAAGAGITPFVPITEERSRHGTLSSSVLIFANKSKRDIILRERWEFLFGLTPHFVTDDSADDLPDGPVDAEFLQGRMPLDRPLYICGPRGFVNSMRKAAQDAGMPDRNIVTEAGW
jgi:ferredoxin-NADP reductase